MSDPPSNEKKDGAVIDSIPESPPVDYAIGEVIDHEYAIETENAHRGDLRRAFKARHVQMIALGGNIGSGLFISTGKALRYGSAVGMLIGYPLICMMALAVMQVMAEACCLFPTSGAFIDHAARFVDPALGFAIGFCEWFGAMTVIAAEGAVFPIIISYWNTSIPTAACMTIYISVVFFFHLMPNRWFAEFQFLTGASKITLMVVVLLTMVAICAGAGPTGSTHHAQNYTELPAFPNGFKGISQTFLLASWATGGQEIIGIASGEARMPRYDLPRASVNLFIRIIVIYTTSVIFITVLVPYTDPLLLSKTSNIAASPFVIAMSNAGIKVLPDIVNVVLLIGLTGIGSESLFTASRIQTAMARMGMMPSVFNRIDKKGRPYWSLLCCALLSAIMTYINCSTGGAVAFTWFSSMSATVSFIAWMVIPLSNWMMHKALRAQGDRAFDPKYSYRNRFWPLEGIFLFVTSFFVLACTFYVSLFPIDASPSPDTFFETYLCVPVFIVAFIVYKVWFRTKFVRPSQADLKSGRKHLNEEDYAFLGRYYSQPLWRRAMSYVRF